MNENTKRSGGRCSAPARSASADAKQSTIAIWLGALSDGELDQVDGLVSSIVRSRHDWARHVGDSKWHLVEDYEHYSVTTQCRGAWPTSDDYDTCSLPPKNERCGACHLVYVATEGQRIVRQLEALFDIEFRTPAAVDAKINDALRELREIAPTAAVRFDGGMPSEQP